LLIFTHSIIQFPYTIICCAVLICFCGHSLLGTVFLYSLDTSDISKTADKVFKMLDDVVEFVGEENVVQVVTDNAANFKAAGELLIKQREHL